MPAKWAWRRKSIKAGKRGLDSTGRADLDFADGDFSGEVHGDLPQVELDFVDVAIGRVYHRLDFQTPRHRTREQQHSTCQPLV